MSPPSPLSALYTANQLVKVLDGRVVLEVAPSTGGFSPGDCGPDDFKKSGRRLGCKSCSRIRRRIFLELTTIPR
jgi:hypothetical protein